jgi:NitT/TauT family transport system substrate-binding protein
MKNIFRFIFITGFAVLLLFLSACNRTNEDSPVIRVAALRGPTALGLLHMMDTTSHVFELVGSPVEIAPLLVRGDVDIAVVPGNMASVLYNQTNGAVQALAVVTLGVLHIVDSTGGIYSVADLAGRTVFATGEGATPEFALNYVLRKNGLEPWVDVFIEFRAEPTEIAALFDLGQAEVALLPEPFVSTITARIDGLRVALDLTEEWNRVQPEYGLIMSVVVARREFLESYDITDFMDEYAQSIAFMTANTPQAAQLAVDFGLIPNTPIALTALPRTHLVFLSGEMMRQNLTGFYRVLYNENPASIGGNVPDADFFFIP